jgi:signal transduction histidine kinase
VSDTGVGIDAATLPLIFDTFTQAERSLDRSRKGLGLGLALVKGLVEFLGGQVQASSRGPGRGAEFTVWLPLAAVSTLV